MKSKGTYEKKFNFIDGGRIVFFAYRMRNNPEKKNILLIYSGLGVDVYYKSNACPDIPGAPKGPAEFIIPAGQVEE
jgi:hypothetical protein